MVYMSITLTDYNKLFESVIHTYSNHTNCIDTRERIHGHAHMHAHVVLKYYVAMSICFHKFRGVGKRMT